MKKILLSFIVASLLTGCHSFNEDNANTFNSLSKNQQAAYWQHQQINNDIDKIKQLGMTVYVQGDQYQIIIPANLLFKGTSPQTVGNIKPLFQAIAELINSQSTAGVQILAYTSATNSAEYNFSLSQSWGQSVLEGLREQGLDVGVLSAQGHGECDNIGKNNSDSNRIELVYKVNHGN